MKKMSKTLLLATATGLISIATFGCRTPDEHPEHPTADAEHPAAEHPAADAEHPASEHPEAHAAEHPEAGDK